MENDIEKKDRMTAILRWTARIIGTIVALFWVLMTIASGIAESSGLTLEGFVIAIMVAGTTIGVFIAWTNEWRGGIISLFLGIAFSTFALISAGRNHVLAMLVTGGPYVVVSEPQEKFHPTLGE